MFTRAHHLSHSWATCIQSTPFHPVSLRSIIIIPSMLRSSEWSLSFRFSDQNYVHICHPPCMLCACPSHPLWCDYPNNIWWSVKIMKLLSMHSSSAFHHFLPFRSKYSPQHPLLILCFSLSMQFHVSHPYKWTGKHMYNFLYFNF